MARGVILASALIAALGAGGCVSAVTNYHGYVSDDAQPTEMEPGIDTRTSVLQRLGSPSTRSIFDDNTWFYFSSVHERVAFFRPEVTTRQITAIRFNESDVVEEVLEYDLDDGEVINYASRETPTLGRQLTLLEQLLGSIGNVALPQTDEATPNNPTGRR